MRAYASCGGGSICGKFSGRAGGHLALGDSIWVKHKLTDYIGVFDHFYTRCVGYFYFIISLTDTATLISLHLQRIYRYELHIIQIHI